MRVQLVGIGLVGGSVGLAARSRLDAHVTGWDPDADAVAQAAQRAAIDAEGFDEQAEIAVVAAPVDRLAEAVTRALAACPAAVVTDVGSTKRQVAEAVADPRFVGGHPLAGAEVAGVQHARDGLFDGARWYLTPTAATPGRLYERLHRFVAGLGAVPAATDPVTHDRMMAAVSHLPHVVANVLVERAARALGEDRVPPTGPSFRDATRVAGANPPLWSAIYAANRDALLEQLDGAIAGLQAARDALAAGDDLTGWQEQAAGHRRTLLESGLAGALLTEVVVVVPNRPGVIADLALTLGREGINIHDMSLSPSADERTGRVALWVAEPDAERAMRLVGEVVAR